MSTAILPKADTSDFLAHFDDSMAMVSDSAAAAPSQKDTALLQKIVGQAIKNVEDAHAKLQTYLTAKYKDSDLTGDVSKHGQYMMDYANAYTALINQNLSDTKAGDVKSPSGSSGIWVRVSPIDLKVTADFISKPSTMPVEISHMDLGGEHLEHFGVLGMHWGRHLPGRDEQSHNSPRDGLRTNAELAKRIGTAAGKNAAARGKRFVANAKAHDAKTAPARAALAKVGKAAGKNASTRGKRFVSSQLGIVESRKASVLKSASQVKQAGQYMQMMNRSLAKKLSELPKYASKNLKQNASLAKQYYTDYTNTYNALADEARAQAKGIDPTFNGKLIHEFVVANPTNTIWKIVPAVIKHDDSPDEIPVKMTYDALGHISHMALGSIAHEDDEGEALADTLDAGGEYLEHFGVLGMHWGRHLPGKGDRTTASNRKKPSFPRDTHPDHRQAHTLQVKDTHRLSNTEIKKVNDRLSLEKKLDDLRHEQSTLAKGQKHIKTVLGLVATAGAAAGVIRGGVKFFSDPKVQDKIKKGWRFAKNAFGSPEGRAAEKGAIKLLQLTA